MQSRYYQKQQVRGFARILQPPMEDRQAIDGALQGQRGKASP
jgi:hypothetical protein